MPARSDGIVASLLDHVPGFAFVSRLFTVPRHLVETWPCSGRSSRTLEWTGSILSSDSPLACQPRYFVQVKRPSSTDVALRHPIGMFVVAAIWRLMHILLLCWHTDLFFWHLPNACPSLHRCHAFGGRGRLSLNNRLRRRITPHAPVL